MGKDTNVFGTWITGQIIGPDFDTMVKVNKHYAEKCGKTTFTNI